jgi:GTP pyrophosphokinase
MPIKPMRRKSGEPYILHPLAVAKICVEEIGLGCTLHLSAAFCMIRLKTQMLHLKTIEKTFGSEIARIVDGLTKISNVIDVSASQQAEILKRYSLPLPMIRA